MSDSLYISATGMSAQQFGIDTIANNLANVNTPGFKKVRVNFQEVIHSENAKTAIKTDAIRIQPQASVGAGVVGSATTIFSGGELTQTGQPLDLAINGEGFVEIVMPDGSQAYSRGGSFQVNRDGYLSTQQGYVVKPALQIPADTTQTVIQSDGRVFVSTASQGNQTEIGQIELAKFASASGLASIGDGLYRPTEASGDPNYGKSGDPGFGTIAQGFVESSNVNLVEEMVNLMVAQRAYEVNTKVVQATDEMAAMVNALRR